MVLLTARSLTVNQTHSPRHQWSLALSILTVLGVGVAALIVGDYHRQLGALEQNTQKQLRLVHDGLYGELLELERGLSEMQPTLSAQMNSAAPEQTAPLLEKETRQLLNMLPALESVMTVDAQGRVRSQSNRKIQSSGKSQAIPVPMLQAGNWPEDSDLQALGQASQTPTVLLRQVLITPQGERVGIIVATLNMTHFQHHLASLHVNEGTSSAILWGKDRLLTFNAEGNARINPSNDIVDLPEEKPRLQLHGTFDNHYAASSSMQPNSIQGTAWPFKVVVWVNAEPAQHIWVRDTSILLGGFALFCALAIWGIRRSNRQRQEQAELSENARAEQNYQQERFLLATENADIGVWEYSPGDGTFIWDWTMRRIYGAQTSPHEIPYTDWLACIVDADRSRVESIMIQATGREGAFEYGFNIKRASDGSLRNIQARAKLHRNEKNQQLRIIGVNMDISHQRRAEQALKEAEERFRSSFESAAVGMAILSARGFFLQVNDALCAIVGYERDELLGRDFLSITHPEDSRLHLPIAKEMAARVRDSYQMEKRYIHKNGHVVWVFLSASAVRGDQGHINHLIVQVQDITERKRQEATLIEREHFLRTLSECLPGLVSYWSTDLRCHFANKNHEKWSSMTSDKMRGQHIRRVLGEDNFTLHLPHIEGVLKGQKQRFEQSKALPTGGYADMLVHLIPDVLYGKVEGFFSISTNITDFKAQQRELERMNHELVARTKQAEAASKAKGAFLANMSHEIRTPMNAIVGLLQLMSDSPLNPGQRDYINKISSAADVLLNVLNDILDLSRVEANQLELSVVRFDLDQLLGKCMGLFSYRAKEKDIQIFCTKENGCPVSLEGDRLRLAQIVNNLLSNAVKFTDSGHIHLNVKMSEDGANLVFTIKDSGIGMTPEQCNQLFKPFSQVDESPSRRYGGAGLGLSICKQLTELMNGQIWVDSAFGQGTAFHFSVPCIAPEFQVMHPALPMSASVEPASPNKDNDVLAGKRVLVVDDHKLNRMVASEMLKKWGASVELATNGLEAVQSCEREPFDWVLMDVQMPEMDGFEATRQIRSKLGTNAPHIIAVTASASEKDRAEVLEAGMSEHVVKPFKKEDLIRIMLSVNASKVC